MGWAVRTHKQTKHASVQIEATVHRLPPLRKSLAHSLTSIDFLHLRFSSSEKPTSNLSDIVACCVLYAICRELPAAVAASFPRPRSPFTHSCVYNAAAAPCMSLEAQQRPTSRPTRSTTSNLPLFPFFPFPPRVAGRFLSPQSTYRRTRMTLKLPNSLRPVGLFTSKVTYF